MTQKTWTDKEGRTYVFDNDKMDFDSWWNSDPNIQTAWLEGCKEFSQWKASHPLTASEEFEGACATIFEQWLVYSNAFEQ